MTQPRGRAPVRCPKCLENVDWAAAEAVIVAPDGTEEALAAPGPREDHTQFATRVRTAVRVCPGTGARHYVPYTYGDYGEPVVIGLVGDTAVGKTLLLTAMVGRLQNATWMDRLGIQVRPLDIALHQRFQESHLDPFLLHGQALAGTRPHDAPVDFAYATTVHYRDGRRPTAIAFFDVAGESLRDAGPHNTFLSAVNALIFVVDATKLLPSSQTRRQTPGDRTFEQVVDQLDSIYRYLDGQYAESFLPIPAVIVVAKADTLDFDRDQPTRRWFAAADDDLDLSTVDQESADVYAFLATRGGDAYLRPAHRCQAVTLHYASAANCKQDADGRFPVVRFRQRRVLKPLLSLLAMKGVIQPQLLDAQHG